MKKKKSASQPFAVTPYYASLAENGAEDPVGKQFIPDERESVVLPYEETDPLCEKKYSPLPRMVHRYPDRILILATDKCAVYCRHCFRRYFTGKKSGRLKIDELEKIAAYIKEHTEIKELLLSGGDPLTLKPAALIEIIDALYAARPDVTVRIASRIPVVLPAAVTDRLVKQLAAYPSVWIVTQFNHPKELTAESRAACRRFTDAGIPVINQAVLLKGVNDDPQTLAEFFHQLVFNKIKPYYLFQTDIAAGTSHFRVNLEKAFEIVKKLRTIVSGLAMPVFAVDLPGGGGKFVLNENMPIEKKDGFYILRNAAGEEFRYPVENL
jgi:lysine 2,3-aminomutase